MRVQRASDLHGYTQAEQLNSRNTDFLTDKDLAELNFLGILRIC